MIMCDDETDISVVDKTVVVCCALCNVCDSVVLDLFIFSPICVSLLPTFGAIPFSFRYIGYFKTLGVEPLNWTVLILTADHHS